LNLHYLADPNSWIPRRLAQWFTRPSNSARGHQRQRARRQLASDADRPGTQIAESARGPEGTRRDSSRRRF